MPLVRADDPVALRSERLFGIFAAYLAWRVSGAFHALRLSRAGPVPAGLAGRPLVVYSNHPSWWDPALFMILSRRLFPGRPGFGPMDEAAFRRYGIFRRMGVFGIALDTQAGARRFLQTSRRALAVEGGMLWITAEGALTDPRLRPLHLRPGLRHLARAVPGTVLLPLALAYDFWNESRPEALVRFGAPIEAGRDGTTRALAARLETGLAEAMDGLAGESVTRDAALFETVVEGRAGSDVFYDAWRRGRAAFRGRRFDPAHERVLR